MTEREPGWPAKAWVRLTIAGLAIVAIGVALVQLQDARRGVTIEAMTAEGTPMTVFRPVQSGAPAPVVVIAHGFAGSQQLMQPFAVTLARAGYVAVTFDFAGHGANPVPLTGSISREDGATRRLVQESGHVVDRAKGLGDGRLALLGHSMATDIIVRVAQSRADIAATVAVSMFSPAVTATSPRNLLVIAGEWEGGLRREALRAVGLVSAPAPPEAGVTYGDVAAGTARRAAVSPRAEHVGVLYNEASLREALAWLDASLDRPAAANPDLDSRGVWILLLLAGVVLLAWPLSALLPRVASPPVGAGLGWRRIALPLILPALLTPILLRFVPTTFLPVIVGDYLAVHFAAYGALTALCVAFVQRGRDRLQSEMSPGRLAVGTLALMLFGLVALAWPVHSFVTAFVPAGHRLPLFAATLAGTLIYFLADEWLTRGEGAARGAFLASKLAFLISLGLAVALDFQRLFFLLIIVPVIVLFFLVYGLFSAWAFRRSGHPFMAGIANAFAFAWAIAATFPLVAR
ncbi:MAG: alpha/beta hydrolase [Bosea sp. (in: a-proteobacteria)]|uniref:alpha/beta fold hydrolase n=1 Tax=Bosea sp. (in: a-proteobacteria) TaxID=1871050 RepID=UPI002733ADA0|nr:alpha/beta fold hydrolase [Bosea sp. (in: a-proteobacteria)]MDP3254940.1 alpha/beta hydrolase [Bosea sp. (in: a-proteobacteria)]MDP3320727.1 alpha/beta hydrolase [Bosea sp. (in: a-proteobacteria)]